MDSFEERFGLSFLTGSVGEFAVGGLGIGDQHGSSMGNTLAGSLQELDGFFSGVDHVLPSPFRISGPPLRLM
jgi:hypothetical protein